MNSMLDFIYRDRLLTKEACSPGFLEMRKILPCYVFDSGQSVLKLECCSVENLREDLHRIKDALGSKKVDLYEVSIYG